MNPNDNNDADPSPSTGAEGVGRKTGDPMKPRSAFRQINGTDSPHRSASASPRLCLQVTRPGQASSPPPEWQR